jgi:anti-anti-sigma regulatory factor
MNLTIKNAQGVALLLAEGSIREQDLKRLSDEIKKLPAAHEKYILLDCMDLKKVIHSSIGFSGLVNQLLDYRAQHAKIILFGYDKQTYRLLQLLKMDNLFHFSQSLDEAYLILNQTHKEFSPSDLPPRT